MSQYLTVNKLQGIVEPKQGVFIVKEGFGHLDFVDFTNKQLKISVINILQGCLFCIQEDLKVKFVWRVQ